jgi:hypothetical protein
MWRQSTEDDVVWPMSDIDVHNGLVANYIEKCDAEVNAFVLTGWPIDSEISPFSEVEG